MRQLPSLLKKCAIRQIARTVHLLAKPAEGQNDFVPVLGEPHLDKLCGSEVSTHSFAQQRYSVKTTEVTLSLTRFYI